MNSGFYAACAGLKAQSQALELISNNVANLSTTGFRGQQTNFRSVLGDSIDAAARDSLNQAVNNFNVLGGSRVDLSAGNLESTGNSLDLAIEGRGFFTVQSKAGTLYTRNGNFQVSAQGKLMTTSGDLVVGENGPVTIPNGEVTFSPDGTLSVDGAVAGKLRVVEFAQGSNPAPVGNSYYSIAPQDTKPATSSYVRQGMLEASNVSSVGSVVQLISVQRKAEMLERAMSLFNANFDHIAANDLPKV